MDIKINYKGLEISFTSDNGEENKELVIQSLIRKFLKHAEKDEKALVLTDEEMEYIIGKRLSFLSKKGLL